MPRSTKSRGIRRKFGSTGNVLDVPDELPEDSVVVPEISVENPIIEQDNPTAQVMEQIEMTDMDTETTVTETPVVDTEVSVTGPTTTDESSLPVDIDQLSVAERKQMLDALRARQREEKAARASQRNVTQAMTTQERAAKRAADQRTLFDIGSHLLEQPLMVTQTAPGGFYRYTGAVLLNDTLYNVTATMRVALPRGRKPKQRDNGDVAVPNIESTGNESGESTEFSTNDGYVEDGTV